jgi:hypothetical protein
LDQSSVRLLKTIGEKFCIRLADSGRFNGTRILDMSNRRDGHAPFRLNQGRIARCLGLLARDRANPVPAITVSGSLFLEQCWSTSAATTAIAHLSRSDPAQRPLRTKQVERRSESLDGIPPFLRDEKKTFQDKQDRPDYFVRGTNISRKGNTRLCSSVLSSGLKSRKVSSLNVLIYFFESWNFVRHFCFSI